jgi:hypothetical protein
MAADEPSGDGLVEFVEMASKEMVGVIDDGELTFTGQRGDEFGNFGFGAVLIFGTMDEKLGFLAAPEIGEIRVVDGNAEAYQIGNTSIGAADAKANPASEAKTHENQGNVREFRAKKIESGLDVALLPLPAVV